MKTGFRNLKEDGKESARDELKKQFEMISELADLNAAKGDYNQASLNQCELF